MTPEQYRSVIRCLWIISAQVGICMGMLIGLALR